MGSVILMFLNFSLLNQAVEAVIWRSTLSKSVAVFYTGRVAKVWNDLLNSVVTAFNIRDFKSQLDGEEVSNIID